MKNKLMISAAAIALIAAGGVASAQQPKQEGPAGAQSAPHAAPAAPKAGGDMKGGAINHGADMKGTTGQASPSEKAAPRAEKPSAGTTGQASPSEKPGLDTKSKAGADIKSKAGTTGQASGEVKGGADMKGHADTKKDMKSTSDTKAGADTKSNMKSSSDSKSTTTTTGQGAAGTQGAVNLSSEQRTKIKTVIKEKSNFRSVTNVNFSISVGTHVPRTGVTFYTLPTEVVQIYPAWRGYKFILVGDEIVVIDPNTYVIVAVIAA